MEEVSKEAVSTECVITNEKTEDEVVEETECPADVAAQIEVPLFLGKEGQQTTVNKRIQNKDPNTEVSQELNMNELERKPADP